jgi:hypothetical protein
MSQSYEPPPPEPAGFWQQAPQVPLPRRRPIWPWLTLGCALAVIGGIIAVVLAVTSGGGEAEPISRSELMAEYAKVAPRDKSATPETIDDIAASTCKLLDNGTASDRVIDTATEIYGAQATQIVRLLVSYKCPKHLAGLK